MTIPPVASREDMLLSVELAAFLDKTGDSIPRVEPEDEDSEVNLGESLSSSTTTKLLKPSTAEPQSTDDDNSNLSALLWHTCAAFMQTLFGIGYSIYTVCLGYVLKYILINEGTTNDSHYLHRKIGVSTATMWPPPALVGLGFLTIVALIVHPDGYTWIFLRALRKTILKVLQSSSTCWAIAVNNYGAFLSSAFAIATFAALLFFCYVLHKTLSPKAPQKKDKCKRKLHKKSKKCGSNRMRHHNKCLNDDEHLPRVLPPLTEHKAVESVDASTVPAQSMDSSALPTQSTPTESVPKLDPPLKYEDEQRNPAVSTSILATAETGNVLASMESSLSSPTHCVDAFEKGAVHVTVESSSESLPALNVDSVSNAKEAQPQPPTERPETRRAKSNREKNARRAQRRKKEKAAPPRTPSKRWDVLKPERRDARADSPRDRRQRSPKNQSPKRVDKSSEGSVPTAKETKSSLHYTSPMRSGFVSSSFESVASTAVTSPEASPPCEAKYLSPSLFESVDLASGPPSLNPDSPSWITHRQVLRPPPGLELRKDIPFGCNASDAGSSAPASPFQSRASVMKSHHPTIDFSQGTRTIGGTNCSRPAVSPFQPTLGPSPFMNDYGSLSFSSNTVAAPSLDYRPEILPGFNNNEQSPFHLKENPFASSDNDDQIEAELQELGGQMVGSVLDF